ncbi:oxidoreductase [Leucobacter sp. CSA1]|uniref:Oxidoreductase n=1 Tax=Leucobacter chromiisoli TaxID=2796471 RepID=A0A934QAY7_9MICO|nr:MDR family oxidoreductase [Leucobacter chromiisoli]MBK0419767.1 oxidoreductase [Leucobacter chromiisoli]
MGFRGIVIEQTVDGGRIREHSAELRDLPESFLDGSGGDAPVDVDVLYSGVNYKDGLAVSGKPGVVRTSPLIPGIDLVGRVSASADDRFSVGETVVLTGGGAGEATHGGLAARARVSGDYLVALPEGLDARRAAAIGTAGLTAMLSILALEHEGADPERGPVVVTGAAGGVGSVAVAVLASLGYRVIAATGRADSEAEYLHRLGAAEILDRRELSEAGPALQKRSWAAGVDTVGSNTLVNVLARTQDDGAVTACGLAQGADLPGTVMPFILRGVTLVGINSVTASRELRQRAWERLSSDLPADLLDEMTTEIPLDDVPARAEAILHGRVRGRTVVSLAE